MTFTVRLAPGRGESEDEFDWEGPGIYRFQHKAISRLLADDRLADVLSPEERALLSPDDSLNGHAPEAVKAALVKAFGKLAPGLREEVESDWDRAWEIPALLRDVGAAVLVCEYAASLGRGVYVTKR